MKFIKGFFKWLLVILVVLNILILVSGRTYLYKAIANTYFKGRSGPAIDESLIFSNRIVKTAAHQPWKQALDYNKQQLPEGFKAKITDLQPVAFMVIKNDSIKYEEYWDGFNQDSHTNSFSMAKSILAVLTGVAIKDGKIKSVNEPVSNYLPEIKAMEKIPNQITIKHLLTMSSGINFNEDYNNPFAYPAESYYGSDLRKQTLNGGYKVMVEPGKYFNYRSGDSQLLAFVLEKATGKHVGDYAAEKLWSKIGAKNDAWWNLDHEDGNEKAFCCFNSNAPDFARIGKLILNRGNWSGQQLVDSSYVNEMLTVANLENDAKEEGGGKNTKYGYQWWLMPNYKGHNIFYMRGILGQYVIMIPDENMIVVRLGHKRLKALPGQDHPEDVLMYIDCALAMYGKK